MIYRGQKGTSSLALHGSDIVIVQRLISMFILKKQLNRFYLPPPQVAVQGVNSSYVQAYVSVDGIGRFVGKLYVYLTGASEPWYSN